AGVTISFTDTTTVGSQTVVTAIGPFDSTKLPVNGVPVPQQFKINGVVVATYTQTDPTHFMLVWGLTDGVHDLRATASDIAGNVAPPPPPVGQPAPITLTVTIDRDALDADRKFIRALYSVALGRMGSLTEWNGWLPTLSQPDGRRLVANGISRSREARTFTVKGWYQTFLGRAADFPAANGWVDQLLGGQTEETVLSRILGSLEYFNHSQ